jgi:hypothetical protein
MNEKELLTMYLGSDVSVCKYTSSSIFDLLSSEYEIISFESKGTQINGPDLYIKYCGEQKVLAIEHFEFDSTKTRIRKGSENNRRNAEINRDYEQALVNVNELGDQLLRTYDYSQTKSLVNYRDNLLRSFKSHYRNITSYKKNLVKAGIADSLDQVKMVFFINDSTLDGNTFYDSTEHSLIQLLPYNIKEFVELLYKSTEIDLMFIGCGFGDMKRIFVLELNKNCLGEISRIPLCDDITNLFNNSRSTVLRKSTLLSRSRIKEKSNTQT